MKSPFRRLGHLLAALALLAIPAHAMAQAAGTTVDQNDDGRPKYFKYGLKVSGMNNAVTAATTTYTATVFDTFITASGVGFTITLPAAAAVPAGHVITIEKVDDGGNGAETIARAASDTIEGATSLVLPRQWDWAELQSDGVSSWNILAGSVLKGSFTTAGVMVTSSNLTLAHAVGGLAAPGAPVGGAGCGAAISGQTTVAGSTDLSGEVGITCGTTGGTAATILTLTFTRAYGAAPHCSVTPANQATALIAVAQLPFAATTTTTMLLTSSSTGLVAGTYLWWYQCTQ